MKSITAVIVFGLLAGSARAEMPDSLIIKASSEYGNSVLMAFGHFEAGRFVEDQYLALGMGTVQTVRLLWRPVYMVTAIITGDSTDKLQAILYRPPVSGQDTMTVSVYGSPVFVVGDQSEAPEFGPTRAPKPAVKEPPPELPVAPHVYNAQKHAPNPIPVDSTAAEPVTEGKTQLLVQNGTAADLEIHVGHSVDRKQSRSKKDKDMVRIGRHGEGIIVLKQGHEHTLRLMYWAGGQRFNREWRYRAFRGVALDTIQIGGWEEGFFQNQSSQLVLVMPVNSGVHLDPDYQNRQFNRHDSLWVKTNYPRSQVDQIISFYTTAVRGGAYLLYPNEYFLAWAYAPQAASFPVYFGLRVVMVDVNIDVIPQDTPFSADWYGWGGLIRPEAEAKAEYVRRQW